MGVEGRTPNLDVLPSGLPAYPPAPAGVFSRSCSMLSAHREYFSNSLANGSQGTPLPSSVTETDTKNPSLDPVTLMVEDSGEDLEALDSPRGFARL